MIFIYIYYAMLDNQYMVKFLWQNFFLQYRKPGLFWTRRGYFGRSCFSMTGAILDIGAILDTQIVARPAYRQYNWSHNPMESHMVIQNRASKIAPFLSKIAPVYGVSQSSPGSVQLTDNWLSDYFKQVHSSNIVG